MVLPALGSIVDKAYYLIPLVHITLLFVPWIILGEGASLVPAVVRNFQLIYRRWWDLLVLLPRWLLIVLPLCALLSTAGRVAVHSASADILWPPVTATVELILLVAVVVLYDNLRQGEVARAQESVEDTGTGSSA